MGLWDWLPVVVLLVLAVVVVDLVHTRRSRHGESRRGGGSIGSTGPAGLGDFVEIFQPTARYRHEETERQRHDVVLPGDADQPWTVDLEAGIASLPARVQTPAP